MKLPSSARRGGREGGGVSGECAKNAEIQTLKGGGIERDALLKMREGPSCPSLQEQGANHLRLRG